MLLELEAETPGLEEGAGLEANPEEGAGGGQDGEGIGAGKRDRLESYLRTLT